MTVCIVIAGIAVFIWLCFWFAGREGRDDRKMARRIARIKENVAAHKKEVKEAVDRGEDSPSTADQSHKEGGK